MRVDVRAVVVGGCLRLAWQRYQHVRARAGGSRHWPGARACGASANGKDEKLELSSPAAAAASPRQHTSKGWCMQCFYSTPAAHSVVGSGGWRLTVMTMVVVGGRVCVWVGVDPVCSVGSVQCTRCPGT